MTFAEALNELQQDTDKPMSRPVMVALMERIATDMQIQSDACRRNNIIGTSSDYVDVMWAKFAEVTRTCDYGVKQAIEDMQHSRASAGAH
jgi:hypothetical protein